MKQFIPKNILPTCSQNLLQQASLIPIAGTILASALEMGYRIYVVNQNRGHCYPSQKVITIPLFAYRKEDKSYLTWYICHELAHFLAVTYDNCYGHGKEFMARLKQICPADAIHHETRYKPKNAALAGISYSKHINTGTIPDDFFA